MNALEIRIHKQPPQIGTCQLTNKKRVEVFTVEIPTGTTPITVSGEAMLHEYRRIMLHESPTPPADDASSEKGTTSSSGSSSGRSKSSSAA